MRALLLCALSLGLAAPSLAQDRRPVDPQEPARRAADGVARLKAAGPAGAIVLRGIERHGGLEAWFAGRAIAFDYTYDPTERPPAGTHQTIDLLASRAYHRIIEPGAGRFAFNGERAWILHEKPGFGAPPRFWSLTPYYFVSLPFVAGDPGVKLQVVDDDPAAAGLPPADVVKLTYEAGTGDAPDDYYVLYFAKDDGRLLACRYIVSYGPMMKKRGIAHTPEKILVYSDFEKVGPLTLAKTHTTYKFPGKRGEKVTDAGPANITFPAQFDETQLDMPAGATISEL